MTTEAKFNCQACGEHLSFTPDDAGMTIECPHCNCKTMLIAPSARKISPGLESRYKPTAAQGIVTDKMIGVGYCLAFFIPLIGFIVGIYFLAKGQFGHGIGCMIVSLISNTLWVFAVIALLSLVR